MKKHLLSVLAAAFGLALLCAAPAWAQNLTVTGFEVGNSANDRVTYVFFEGQCPSCAALWAATRPLQLQMRFVWVPVATADLPTAPPKDEARWAARQGGVPVTVTVPASLMAALEKNTRAMYSSRTPSPPIVVGKNLQGQVVTSIGSKATESLAEFLELEYIPGQ